MMEKAVAVKNEICKAPVVIKRQMDGTVLLALENSSTTLRIDQRFMDKSPKYEKDWEILLNMKNLWVKE